MRFNVVIRYIGMVLLLVAAFMLLSAGISYLNNVDTAYFPLLMSSLLTLLMGCFPMIFVPRSDHITNKEGYCIVVGAWIVSSIVGTFPYLMWGGEFSIINAWFESVSGFTTTGASILNDVEDLPQGLQFWRMTTCWMGGIGVVMFALVILPAIGKSKMMLSNVELSSMAKNNFHYRSQTVVRIVLAVYVGLTAITTLALKIAGMRWFDAVAHAMSACSTCGFSTKNLSMAFFDSPVMEIILIVSMALAGVHFGVIYATVSGRPNNLFRSENIRHRQRPPEQPLPLGDHTVLLRRDSHSERGGRHKPMRGKGISVVSHIAALRRIPCGVVHKYHGIGHRRLQYMDSLLDNDTHILFDSMRVCGVDRRRHEDGPSGPRPKDDPQPPAFATASQRHLSHKGGRSAAGQ